MLDIAYDLRIGSTDRPYDLACKEGKICFDCGTSRICISGSEEGNKNVEEQNERHDRPRIVDDSAEYILFVKVESRRAEYVQARQKEGKKLLARQNQTTPRVPG